MKIKYTDTNDTIIANLEIQFEFNRIKRTLITDSDGTVEFSEAVKGDIITCYLTPKDKQKFVFEPEDEIILVFRPLLIGMVFVAVTKEGKPVVGANLIFEFAGNKMEKTSDFSGQIVVENVPVNAEVKAYQIEKGETINITNHKCLINKLINQIIVDIPVEKTTMKIKLVDKSGQIIRDVQIRIKIDNKEYDEITGQDGCVIIENVEVGSVIECKQVKGNKQFPWHKFKCEIEIDEYILHGEKPSIYNGYSDKIDSQVRMKFRLVNSKGIPIPNAVLKIEYGDLVRHKYSNQSGETMIDDLQIGDKIKVFVDIRGKSTQMEFICQEDNELHEIVFKSNNFPVYFWLIPLFLVVVFIVYFASSSSNEETIEKSTPAEPKKDSVIVTKYSFYIKSTKTNLPIAGAGIKLVYPDTLVERISDKSGFASFSAFAHHLPIKYELKKLGYLPVSETFKLDSIFNLKMATNDSMEIDPVIALCGNEFQSKGIKTTIRSFKMNMDKGRFNLWYNMFNFPTKIDVYKGGQLSISPANLIYSSQAYAKGIGNPVIILDSPDSIITVSMEGNTSKTGWVYKVYCAKIPVKTTVQPIVPDKVNPL